MKRKLWLLPLLLIVFFLVSFEFFHTDTTITLKDNCPIGRFETSSPLHVPPELFVLIIILSLVLIGVKEESEIFYLILSIPSPKRRAPPFIF